ncbi:MAG TPA: hypothetical protein VFC39_12000 [Acidobacteriaceae bacterium]|nr:hypothetical protein [Acidobacteriaceae bacterium]
MKPNEQFLKQPKTFWAYVRSISESLGYTVRKGALKGSIRVPTIDEMADALIGLELDSATVKSSGGGETELGARLIGYFSHRAGALNIEMPNQLMNAEQARDAYEQLRSLRTYDCPFPLNKQKGAMRAPAYLTCLVNMIVETEIGNAACNFDPRSLTTITVNGAPVRTLARRVDGAFPKVVNPKAIWEVKEYYYTTSFGSRIADGVYETMLDGMELEELHTSENIHIKHYLMIDGYKTWWEDGKSYLCRIVDMLHMGYVDEVLVGREVPALLPEIVRSWLNG